MGKIQCAEMLKVEKMLQFINSIKSGFNVSVPIKGGSLSNYNSI